MTYYRELNFGAFHSTFTTCRCLSIE